MATYHLDSYGKQSPLYPVLACFTLCTWEISFREFEIDGTDKMHVWIGGILVGTGLSWRLVELAPIEIQLTSQPPACG